MRNSAKIIWDPLIDAVVDASWNNRHGKAARVVKTLLKAIRDTQTSAATNSELMRAFYRLIDFYCMENDYDKAYKLCENLLKAQQEMYGINDPCLMDTLIRISKIGQLRSAESAGSEKTCSMGSELIAHAQTA
ncbi:MAG: hypothetical protein JST89_26715 [Cyanobacteria bacterium SZAS-4]|nr:hypothetical protein [Cyanobacteria bacterium SZAS-4]